MLVFFFCLILGYKPGLPALSVAEEPVKIFDLEQTIRDAIEANLGLKISQKETEAALSTQKAQRTNFLPTFGASYRYRRIKEPTIFGSEIAISENEYTVTYTFSQPVFRGFSILNQYKLANLGIDVSKFKEKLIRQDVILAAKQIFFELLKSKKLMEVAHDTEVVPSAVDYTAA